MRKKIQPPLPSSMVCALLLDGKRALFLVKKRMDGTEEIELPCVAIMRGEDPAGAAKAELRRATGIDGHAVGTVFTGEHNCGNRKRKIWIPAIAFRIEAKNTRATPSAEYAGVKWLEAQDAARCRISRKCEWIVRHI